MAGSSGSHGGSGCHCEKEEKTKESASSSPPLPIGLSLLLVMAMLPWVIVGWNGWENHHRGCGPLSMALCHGRE